MVVIRLARTGSNKNPFYHIVVTDKRSPRDGRFIERIGHFNPMARGKETRIKLDLARVEHWLKHGAQQSERVKHLIQAHKDLIDQDPAAKPTNAELRQQQAQTAHEANQKKAKAAASEAEQPEAEDSAKDQQAE